MSDPYARTTWQGKVVDYRTKTALLWAQKRFQRKYPKARLELAQGSYNKGGVSASAGTHDLGGVVDVRTVPLSKGERKRMLRSLRRAGFAAWVRDSRDGMDPHIHCVLLKHRDGFIAPLAAAQATDYLSGRNGLANHARDRNTWRPDPLVRWSHKRGKPVPL